jgi:hypothetical protein
MTSSGLSLTLKDILLAQALLSLPFGGEDWMNICSRLCKQIMARLFSEGVFLPRKVSVPLKCSRDGFAGPL